MGQPVLLLCGANGAEGQGAVPGEVWEKWEWARWRRLVGSSPEGHRKGANDPGQELSGINASRGYQGCITTASHSLVPVYAQCGGNGAEGQGAVLGETWG